jgi:hypothetical protein
MESPEDFNKVIKDFVKDLLTTFPELRTTLDDSLSFIHTHDDTSESLPFYKTIFTHIMRVLPPHFFNILNQSDDLFKQECELLPGIDFKLIWSDKNVSKKTRDIIWKYLQLIMFLIIGETKDFDMSKMFQDGDLKNKMHETMENMKSFFDDHLPDSEKLNNHLEGLMNSKIGALAQEIANETSDELRQSFDGSESMTEVFQKMMKDPKKLMGLVSSVGSKVESKIKNGDIKESELMQEASDLLKKMKDIPGMGNFENIFKNMAKGGKADVNAMQSQLSRNMATAKTKERMLSKLKERQQKQEALPEVQEPKIQETFSTGETVEKTKKKKNKKK